MLSPGFRRVAWFLQDLKSHSFRRAKVVATIAEKIAKTGPFNVDIIVSGVSVGRDSAIRSLINAVLTLIPSRTLPYSAQLSQT